MRLQAALNRISQSGLKLNRDKCSFKQSQLSFMGHVIGRDGTKPDPEKIQAILDFKPPNNVTETRQLLGMVQYLGQFLPNFSNVTRPLNDLLKSDRAWTWGPSQETAFAEVKHMITTAPVLAYYELGRPTLVSADASSYGIGGSIMQEYDDGWRPVAFCSRTLSDSERRYAQIEKECLVCPDLWATAKVSGGPAILQAHHRPQTTCSPHEHQNLDQVPVRCQRLLIRMMRFNPTMVYAPGKSLVIADTLSCNPGPYTRFLSDLEGEVAAYIATVEANHPASLSKLQQLCTATQSDRQLTKPMEYTLSGWPKHTRDVDPLATHQRAVLRERTTQCVQRTTAAWTSHTSTTQHEVSDSTTHPRRTPGPDKVSQESQRHRLVAWDCQRHCWDGWELWPLSVKPPFTSERATAAHSTPKSTMGAHWSRSLWVEGASIHSSRRLLPQVDRDYPHDIDNKPGGRQQVQGHLCTIWSADSARHRQWTTVPESRVPRVHRGLWHWTYLVQAHTFHRTMGRPNEQSRQQSASWSRKTPLWHCWATARLPFLPLEPAQLCCWRAGTFVPHCQCSQRT